MSLFLGFCVAFLWHQSDNRGERAGEIERARGVNPKRGKREREREVFFFHEVVERLLDLSSSLFFFLRVFLFAQSFLFCFVDLSVSFLLSSYSSSVAKRQSGVERGGGREEACCCSGYFQRKRAKKFPLFFFSSLFSIFFLLLAPLPLSSLPPSLFRSRSSTPPPSPLSSSWLPLSPEPRWRLRPGPPLPLAPRRRRGHLRCVPPFGRPAATRRKAATPRSRRCR